METTEHDDTGHPVAVFVHETRRRLAELAGARLWSLSDAEATDLVREAAALVAQVAELDLRCVREADRRDLADAAGMPSTGAWLAHTTVITRGEANRKVRLAQQTETHQATRTALAHGDVGVEQVAAITQALGHLDDVDDVAAIPADRARAEAHLLLEAKDHDAHSLRRLGHRLWEVLDPDGADAHENALLERQEARARARTTLSMRDDGDGLTMGRFAIPTAQASMLTKVLTSLAAPQHVRAVEGAGSYDLATPTPARLGQALCDLIERVPAAVLPTIGGISATVVITADYGTLLGLAMAARLDTGVSISAGQLRRLACSAGILPAIMDGASQVLDLGRKQRFHSPAQRTAKTVERSVTGDPTCESPGCPVAAMYCDMHHPVPWSRGGHTSLHPSELLCGFHHRQAHSSGATYPMRT